MWDADTGVGVRNETEQEGMTCDELLVVQSGTRMG
jgi:hypothetical protein